MAGLVFGGQVTLSEVKSDFKGERITSLHKLDFALSNSGRLPVRGDEVLEPITVAFPKDSKVLAAAIERTFPEFKASITQEVPAASGVSLVFQLMNPGDKIWFSVYLYNSENRQPRVLGRVVDMKEFRYANRRVDRKRDSTSTSNLYWLSLVFMGFVTFMFAYVTIQNINSYRRYVAWKAKWGEAYDNLVAKYTSTTNEDQKKAILQELTKIETAPQPQFKDLRSGMAYLLTMFVLIVLSALVTYFIFGSRQ